MSLIKAWTVQLVKAVMDLHSKSIYVQDLNPSNILLSDNGELVLTYQYQWLSVENPLDTRALNQLYCAPEVITLIDPSPEADWWSVGVILFEILTGWAFVNIFPSGIKSHTPLIWNEDVDNNDLREGEAELRELISQFVQPLPEMRLSNIKDIQK